MRTAGPDGLRAPQTGAVLWLLWVVASDGAAVYARVPDALVRAVPSVYALYAVRAVAAAACVCCGGLSALAALVCLAIRREVLAGLRRLPRACFVEAPGGGALEAVYCDRLGNNVFQYAYTRLRAAHERKAFGAPPLPPPFGDAAARVPDPERLRLAPGDMDAATFLAAPLAVHMQNRALYRAHYALLRGWLAPSVAAAAKRRGLDAAARATDGAVVVHMRVGDTVYGMHTAYRPLPLSYLYTALALLGAGGDEDPATCLVLVTEDAGSRVVRAFAERLRADGHVVRVQCASAEEDFLTLATARRLVMSVSTFAWWAAFLGPALPGGEAMRVVYPEWGLLARCVWRPAPGAPAVLQDLRLEGPHVHRVPLDHVGRWRGLGDIASLLDVPEGHAGGARPHAD